MNLRPERTEKLFSKKHPALTPKEAKLEANRCLFCYDAPCVKACPTSINIPQFIRRIADDDLQGSAEAILDSNLLGLSCSKVCPVEVLCVGSCVYNIMENPPISIGRLQEYALENVPSELSYRAAEPRQTTQKVALVGAGPASLACAGYLALAGVETVIFEQKELPGGLNTYGVAPYKLTLEESLIEIKRIEGLGVKFQFQKTLGRDFALQDLLKDYDAVFLGLGLGQDRLLLESKGLTNVFGATAWIEQMKTGQVPLSFEHPIVLGGGNTALDIAQELAFLLQKPVSLAYRRTRADMKGYSFELKAALEKGVRLLENHAPLRLEKDGDRCVAVVFATEQEERSLPVDGLFFATGQEKHRLSSWLPEAKLNEDFTLWVDPKTNQTSLEKVYAGGDLINGGKEVVNAVEDGKIAAWAMLDKWNKARGYGKFRN